MRLPVHATATHVVMTGLTILVAVQVSIVGGLAGPPSWIVFMTSWELPRETGPAGEPEPTPGWNLTITNKENSQDYPTSVTVGNPYAFRYEIRVEVPSGQVGHLRIESNSVAGYEPHPRLVSLYQDWPILTDLGPGIHELSQTLETVAPIVYRDSYAYSGIIGTVRGPESSTWDAIDSYGYRVDVWPVDRAADVVVRGTVSDWRGPDLNRGVVVVGEIVSDPTGAIEAGSPFDIVSDPGEFPEGFEPGDIVEIHGDFHPAETRIVLWQDDHSAVLLERPPSNGPPPAGPMDAWRDTALIGASLGIAVVLALIVNRGWLRKKPTVPRQRPAGPEGQREGRKPL